MEVDAKLLRQFCGVRCAGGGTSQKDGFPHLAVLSSVVTVPPHCHRFLSLYYSITTLVQPQVELQCYTSVRPGRGATRHAVHVLYQYRRVLCQAVQLKHEHIRVAVAHSNQWREGVRGVACHGQYDDDGERR